MKLWNYVVTVACLGFPCLVTAAELCFAPSTSPGGLGRNVTVDCTTPDPLTYDNSWIGYSTTGTPCSLDGFPCPPSPAPAGAGTPDVLWTISNSDSNPFANSGPLDPLDTLFLWVQCSSVGSLCAAAFDLVGDINVVGINYGPDALDASGGSLNQLIMALVRVEPPILVAEILVSEGPISVDDSSWGAVKALYR